MRLISIANGGGVEVSDEFAAKLIATGTFKKPSSRKPAAKPAATEEPKEA